MGRGLPDTRSASSGIDGRISVTIFFFPEGVVDVTKPKLRAVAPDEEPVPAKPLTLAEAVETGDHYQILVAQRRQIVVDMRDANGPAKAALHRQLSLLSKEIAAIDATDDDDEIGHAAKTPDDDWDESAI